jgi:hypothetical protein
VRKALGGNGSCARLPVEPIGGENLVGLIVARDCAIRFVELLPAERDHIDEADRPGLLAPVDKIEQQVFIE